LISFLFFFVGLAVYAVPQVAVVTETGRSVILADDGTWSYVDNDNNSNIESKWISSIRVDPLSDAAVIVCMIAADTGEGVYGDTVYAILRFSNEDADVYISWESYISDPVVTTRFGTLKPDTYTWTASTDNQATFLNSYKVAAFISLFQSEDKFVAQVTPYGESPITAIFDIRGLTEELKQYPEYLSQWIIDSTEN